MTAAVDGRKGEREGRKDGERKVGREGDRDRGRERGVSCTSVIPVIGGAYLT